MPYLRTPSEFVNLRTSFQMSVTASCQVTVYRQLSLRSLLLPCYYPGACQKVRHVAGVLLNGATGAEAAHTRLCCIALAHVSAAAPRWRWLFLLADHAAPGPCARRGGAILCRPCSAPGSAPRPPPPSACKLIQVDSGVRPDRADTSRRVSDS